VNQDARSAAERLIAEGFLVPRRKTFIYVNNRLEGNALETIYAVVRALDERERRRELPLGADGRSYPSGGPGAIR
jgi:hypothetical protein